MADSYTPGEKKIRPGAHYHIGKKGTDATAGAVNGVTAVLFRADFGPLCTAVEMSSDRTGHCWRRKDHHRNPRRLRRHGGHSGPEGHWQC